MKWSFHIARIAGIDVRVHATFFLLLAWFGFAYYEAGGAAAAASGLAFILLLFTCVVLHEFGHALAARAYGINTPDITLLPIGGVARLDRLPDKPWQEFVVALAGPAVNVVIALALFLVLGRFLNAADMASLDDGAGNLLGKVLAINVILVVFNLVPAFPMDGGRVLRALLAMRLRYGQATRIAATIGQGVAVLFAVLGLFGNPMLLFIAVFVFFGAQQEAAYALLKDVAEDTRVAQIMQPMPPVFQTGMSVLQAAQLAMRESRGEYPVVDHGLRVVGTVPAGTLAAALPARMSDTVDALVSADFEAIPAEASVARALATAKGSARTGFPVVNAAGQLVGFLTRDELAEFFSGGGAGA